MLTVKQVLVPLIALNEVRGVLTAPLLFKAMAHPHPEVTRLANALPLWAQIAVLVFLLVALLCVAVLFLIALRRLVGNVIKQVRSHNVLAMLGL